MTSDLMLCNARLPDGRLADVSLSNGRISAIDIAAAVKPAATQSGRRVGSAQLDTVSPRSIDAAGALLLPGLVDGHAHLDKTLWGTPWFPHQAGPTLMDRIDGERRVLRELKLSPHRQSTRLLRHMLARGTTHVRSHVDIGPEIGLSHFHGLQQTRESHRDLIDMQLVAFPQSGVMRQPGTLDLLDAAVQEGAEVIGGLDPSGIDGDAAGQLDGIFAIASRRGCEIDIHLHERGEQGARSLDMICDRAEALGLRSRVSIGHAFCLGMLPPERLEPLLDRMARLDMAVMTHAPGGYTPFPPVLLLAERGIRLFTGSDGVRDTWSPMNTGDMLERAYLIAYNSGFREDSGLELALQMACQRGAQVMGAAAEHGVAVGKAADLFLVDAETAAEAVAMHPPRKWVFKRGRVVAQDGHATYPDLDPGGSAERG